MSVSTDEDGNFVFPSVPVGTHTLQVSGPGLTPIKTSVRVRLDQTTTVPVTLQVAGAAVLIVFDFYTWAASIIIVASLLDLVDGSLARRTGKTTPFGSFLDSTLDRLSEGAIFAAIAYRLAIPSRFDA